MTRAMRRALALLSVVWSTAAAQELTLREDCEAGFRRFIQMAQRREMGDDVTNANVSVDGKRVDVELVRSNAPSTFLRLRPKQSAQTFSRFFDVVPGAGASSRDAEHVGHALDAAFAEDPFDIVGLEGTPGDDPIPGLRAAWGYGGWRGVTRVLERRMMVLASVRYTMTVFVGLVIGVFASVVLLWASVSPPRS